MTANEWSAAAISTCPKLEARLEKQTDYHAMQGHGQKYATSWALPFILVCMLKEDDSKFGGFLCKVSVI